VRPLVGVVLAGGASSRFGGEPKGLQEVGGLRVIDRVVAALRGTTTDLVLAANDPDAANWLPGVAVLADRVSGTGGLAGVDAALTSERDVLVVAWDMPFVTAQVASALVDLAHATDADVVVPESESPFGFEPFCAFYAARVGPALSAFLAGGGRAPRDFLARLTRVERVPRAKLALLGDVRRTFMSVNSPEDLAKARALAGSAQ
jgi:molybdopterin-guanine dinucleotide biosynthesis protein A